MPTNIERFMEIYAEELASAHAKFPNNYVWSISELPTVLAHMKQAILNGTMNKDSQAFRRTCKRLGIPHTYKAIAAFVWERGE